jgi:hypothetical protein
MWECPHWHRKHATALACAKRMKRAMESETSDVTRGTFNSAVRVDTQQEE